jgi:2-polyprenyl-6-methoxyphenol hydroxylase-like FAD-dependent oxidoreductase
MRRRVAIVGAGIAGLAAAIALRDGGVEVEIVERRETLTEIGAAISIWPNALAACEALGIAEAIHDIGAPEMQGGARTSDGRWLARADDALIARYLGGPSVLLHRAELQIVLLEAARDVPLRLGTACVEIFQDPSGAGIRLGDGRMLEADAVIGCDGIWSRVRTAQGDHSRPTYSGLTGWRAIIDNPGWVEEGWISAGAGNQFLASPMSRSRLFLATAVHLNEGEGATISDPSAFLRDSFRTWHGPIGALLEATPASSWIATDFYHRTPPRWMAHGRIALAGDAAHPMTPDLGQGGCQALEDAVILGRCFSVNGDVEAAIRHYEARRLGRVRRVVSASARIGRVMSTESRFQAGLRNQALRMTPPALRLRYLAEIAARRSFERTCPE